MSRAVLLPLALLACKQNDTEVQLGQLVTGVAVGGRHGCAILSGGTVRCFGDDSAGQLGDGAAGATSSDAGDASGSTTSQYVVGITSATGIAAGFAHSCARLDDGGVRCWGANDFGQLGDGTTLPKNTPMLLSLAHVKAISAGGAHTCALLEDGTAMCWGRNDDGQLGDGSTTLRPLPVAVTGLSAIRQLVAGMFHTCARLEDGTVRCWGRNDAGQIGDGSVGTPRTFPVAVSGLTGAHEIAAGLSDSCAVLSDGSLRCWGRATGSSSAKTIAGFPPIDELSIATGPTTEFCGRARDHSVRCTTVLGGTPRSVPGILDAVQLSAGGLGTCARSSNGALRCFSPGGTPSAVLL